MLPRCIVLSTNDTSSLRFCESPKSTKKTGTNIVSTYKTTSGKSKLISATKGKTYYYKVRAYKTVDGKKIYGYECYRQKREASLRSYAEKKAQRVLKAHRRLTLEPMNAYERHVIHTALQDVPGVMTYSTGVDPNRRVIVACDRDKK